MTDVNSFKLTSEQKLRLWSIGTGKARSAGRVEDHHAKTELLLELLAKPWPIPKPKSRAAFGQKQLYRDLLGDAGLNIGDILFNPKAELDTLKAIRKYGSKLYYYDSDPIKRSAGVALYYGAIAAALLCVQEKITEQNFPDLLKNLRDYSKKPWVAPELQRLLREAGDVCERNVDTKI